MRLCSVDGCGRKHVARGYCGAHYWRWLEYGEVNTALPVGGAGMRLCSIDGSRLTKATHVSLLPPSWGTLYAQCWQRAAKEIAHTGRGF
jgi:hypothetical protein